MKLPFKLQRKYTLAILGAWVSVLLVLGVHYTSSSQLLRAVVPSKEKQPENDATVTRLPRVPTVILFPRDYPVNDQLQLAKIYEKDLGRALPSSGKDTYFVGKYSPDSFNSYGEKRSRPLTQSIIAKPFESAKFSVFTQYGDNRDRSDKCGKAQTEIDIGVSKPFSLDSYMHDIVNRFYHSPLYHQHVDVFKKHGLEQQLKTRTVHEYWARFGGSSVYLEQYGVHLMVSRLVYSADKQRGKPTVSLLLGEVYDHHWNLIPNVKLVVPSNMPGKEPSRKPDFDADGLDKGHPGEPDSDHANHGEHQPQKGGPDKAKPKADELKDKDDNPKDDQSKDDKPEKRQRHESRADAQLPDGKAQSVFRVFDASSVFPSPIFERLKTIDGLFYGPEDPRMLLITNEHGYEEPLILFNEWHRKYISIEENNIDEPKLKLKQFRSMFQCFPFQVQRGMENVDGVPSTDAVEDDRKGLPTHHGKLYTKVVEMRITGKERPGIQKNWTPFVSAVDKEAIGHHKYVYIVYRWTNFEVMRCALKENESGLSDCEFVYQSKPDTSISEGPGPFRGGTALISVNEMLISNLEAFPQIETLISGLKTSKREVWVGFARAHLDHCGCGDGSFYRPNLVIVTREFDGRFVLTHVGSYTSLNVPMMGWDLNDPDKVCPPGLPTSVLIPNLIAHWTLQDDTSEGEIPDDYMALTLSIADANNVVVHILGFLKAILHMDMDQNGDVQIFNTAGTREPRKPTNDPIECALGQSKRFCKAFGEAHN